MERETDETHAYHEGGRGLWNHDGPEYRWTIRHQLQRAVVGDQRNLPESTIAKTLTGDWTNRAERVPVQ